MSEYSKDNLGNRMKAYEEKTRGFIPPKTYTIIRLDGNAFHTWTKGLQRPYDQGMMEAMTNTTKALCENISNVVFAYTQSDEISLLLSDQQSDKTQAWFGGNIQKIASISASMCTAFFNSFSPTPQKLAFFDSRVFYIETAIEVMNNFLWRQKDCQRNAISMIAQHHYSLSVRLLPKGNRWIATKLLNINHKTFSLKP